MDQREDIVTRLRREGENAMRKHLSMGMWQLCAEAADVIEGLRSERDTLDVMAEVGFSQTMQKGATVEQFTAALRGIEIALARDGDIDGAMILVHAALHDGQSTQEKS